MSTFLLSCLIAMLPLTDDGPAADIPQLTALDHYAGDWTVAMTVESLTDPNENQDAAGTVVGRWILRGRFLEQTGTYHLEGDGPPLIIRTLMTFDVQRGCYRYWYFLSTGQTYESTGVWNRESQTMVSTTHDVENNSKRVIEARFDDGSELWSIETIDGDGKVIGRIRGRNTRTGDKSATFKPNSGSTK